MATILESTALIIPLLHVAIGLDQAIMYFIKDAPPFSHTEKPRNEMTQFLP